MRTRDLVSFFRSAVLATLALPACGSSANTGTDAGAPPSLPHTPCHWSSGPYSACQWQYNFQGDPSMCTGFAESGATQDCTICGANPDGILASTCFVTPGGGGSETLTCQVMSGPTCGRVPIGNGGRRASYFASLGFGPAPRGRELGMHFARVACMEAGSVDAFRMLRDELIAHGAPRRLVRAARRAVRDEERHVRQTSALARRFREAPVAARPAPPRALRSLEVMALDNAVEGCVRETYSALECAWQAEVATDLVVRATMKRIARDEMRHLALSWEVHAWARGRLDAANRAALDDAQRAEIAEMTRELSTDPHASLLGAGGLPRASQSHALLRAIADRLAA